MATGDVSILSTTGDPDDILTLAQAKNFIRVTVDTKDDELITSQIFAAIQIAENYLSRDILSKTREQYIRRVKEDRIELYFPPIASIQSVFVGEQEQIEGEGYTLEGAENQQYIILNQDFAEDVVIKYTTVGIANDNVIRQGVYSIVRDLYEDGTVSDKYKSILDSEKLLYI